MFSEHDSTRMPRSVESRPQYSSPCACKTRRDVPPPRQVSDIRTDGMQLDDAAVGGGDYLAIDRGAPS